MLTKNDQFYFTATARVEWRVDDPARVVQERIYFGDRIVRDHVFDLMRRIGRRYLIQECERAEDEINGLVAAGPIALARFGLAVDHVSAHVTLDERTRQYLQRLETLRYDREEQAAEQQNEQLLEAARMTAVADGVQGEFGLITMILRQNPGDAKSLLNLLYSRQQELEQKHDAKFASSRDLFLKLLDSGALNNAELEDVREQVLREMNAGLTAGATPTPTSGFLSTASLAGPTPAITAPPAQNGQPSGGNQAVAAQPAPPAQPAPAPANGPAPPADASGVAGWRPRKLPPRQP
jgi:hypothetical protein